MSNNCCCGTTSAEMTVEECRIIRAVSPKVTLIKEGKETTITVKDVEGEKSAVIRDGGALSDRVSSLNTTPLAGATVIETVGIPVYVNDVSQYAEYNLTEAGWYIFARIAAESGTTVTEETAVTGAAGYIAALGAAYIDVAVRFGVAAVSQTVTVDWGTASETFVFKATDLAIDRIWDYISETPAQGERF